MPLRFAALAACFVGLAGCRGDPIAGLGTPDTVTLYSLDGLRYGEVDPSWTGERFHATKVFGKVEVTDADKRRELIAALKSGAEARPKVMIACFWPRHGLRITEGGRTVDVLICFQCQNTKTHQGDSTWDGAFSSRAEPAFDAVLNDAGIPLAPKSRR